MVGRRKSSIWNQPNFFLTARGVNPPAHQRSFALNVTCRKQAKNNARHIKGIICVESEGEAQTSTLGYEFNRGTLRVRPQREGRYLLRTNIKETDPAKLCSNRSSIVSP